MRMRGVSLMIVILLSVPASAAPLISSSVVLNGKHRFSMGDDPTWAAPEYDDSSWRLIEVPGNWRSQGVRPLRGIGWYRIHFNLPQGFRIPQPAVQLGIIGDVDEVYLNGVKIGGEGRIGNNFVLPPYIKRVYRIPERLLKYDRPNILAVRVMNLFFDGGIVGRDILISDYRDLLVERTDRQVVIKASEIAMLSLIGLFLLASLFLYIKGVRESIYFAFLLFIYGGIFLLESLVFYQTGLKNPIIQRLDISLMGIFPVGLLIFVLKFFNNPFRLFYKIIACSTVLISIIAFFIFSFNTFPFFMLLWIGYILPVYTVTILILIIRAYRKDRPKSGPILIGITGFVIASLTGDFTTFFHLGLEKVSYPLYPWDYGMVFFLLCIMYGMIARFIQTRDRMHLLASKILAAHEEERKRLARELHDSLGQTLLAVKFNLQRVNQKLQDREIGSIVTEIDRSIEELREISMGLRPAMLAEMGLGTALKLFSKRFVKKTGINVEIKVDIRARPPSMIEENLFRVFQEALSNVARHSGADKVEVSVKQTPTLLIMQIRDNGRGFELKSTENRGIGLSTMAERADLMEGLLRIQSSKGRGTTIIVEVPYR